MLLNAFLTTDGIKNHWNRVSCTYLTKFIPRPSTSPHQSRRSLKSGGRRKRKRLQFTGNANLRVVFVESIFKSFIGITKRSIVTSSIFQVSYFSYSLISNFFNRSQGWIVRTALPNLKNLFIPMLETLLNLDIGGYEHTCNKLSGKS